MAVINGVVRPLSTFMSLPVLPRIEKPSPTKPICLNTADSLKLNTSGSMIQGFTIDGQGNTNACGTTSLAAVLRYFGYPVKDHWEIDKSIRSTRFDFFTTPRSVMEYASSKGLRTGMKLNASLNDLANMVNHGVPVMILIDTTPNDKSDPYLHWEVVTGYKRDMAGNIDKLILADPASGSTEEVSSKEFLKKWSNIYVGPGRDLPLLGKVSVSTGYNRLFIAMVPPNKLLKTPSGTFMDSNCIKLPKDSDTFKGFLAYGAGNIASFTDKAIGVAESVGSAISDGASYVGNKIKSFANGIANLF